MITKTHRRVVLARRPPGEPSETDFRIEEVAVPEPGSGQVLVRVIYLSLDPYMRGRMRDAASYAAPVGIGTALSDRDRAKLRWMAGATKMPGGLHDQCFHLLYRCASGRASRLG